jgi:acetyltransferase/esterase
MTTHTLVVPNGTLYYEIRGSGPLLVLISGGNGGAGAYKSVTIELSRHFRVVTYDRRGYSRSTYTYTPEYKNRVLIDADDVACLIKRLSPDTPAIVFGSGSGAIVALTFLARHSALVRTLVVHEPPAVTLLPNGEQIMEAIERVYDEFQSGGVQPAIEMFSEVIGATDGIGTEGTDSYAPANLKFWMEHEMRQYPRTKVDIEALKGNVDRLLLVSGRDGKNLMSYQPSLVFAKTMGSEVIDLPGGHLGYQTHPKEFATGLLAALEHKDISHGAGIIGNL